MSELLTVQELADYLKVTVKTVYRLLENKEIPATRIGHLWRFNKDTIDAWMRQNSTTSKAGFLVIDDDPSTVSLFKIALQKMGHLVTSATDSIEGLKLVEAKSFDMVFLDLMMPGMDGAEVFKRIRAARPDLPVTIITGYPDSEMMRIALETGPFSVMKKPFTGSEIITSVNTYLHLKMPSK